MTVFACLNCGSVYEERHAGCMVCLESGLIVPLPEKGKVKFERPNRQGCKDIIELRSMKNSGRVIQGFESLGKLPVGFKILLSGMPGSGKSSLALQISNNYVGSVLYASIEESFSESFTNKLKTWEITNKDIIFSDCKSMMELRGDIEDKEISLVVVDSLSVLGQVPELPEGLSQIWVCHSTKAGNYKGDSELGHLVDIIILCDAGIASVGKNRFAPPADINIFGRNENEKNDLSILHEQ